MKFTTLSYKIFVIDPNGFELVGDLIAQNALDNIQDRSATARVRASSPPSGEYPARGYRGSHVGGDFFFGDTLAGGADNKAARRAFAVRLQNALQALALFFARDFARNAQVRDARHEDHIAARQGNMRSDARALLPERLLGDLNDNFLSRLQQLGNGRHCAAVRPFAGAFFNVGRLTGFARLTGFTWLTTALAAALSLRRGTSAGARTCPGLKRPLPPRRRRMRRGPRCMERFPWSRNNSRLRRAAGASSSLVSSARVTYGSSIPFSSASSISGARSSRSGSDSSAGQQFAFVASGKSRQMGRRRVVQKLLHAQALFVLLARGGAVNSQDKKRPGPRRRLVGRRRSLMGEDLVG